MVVQVPFVDTMGWHRGSKGIAIGTKAPVPTEQPVLGSKDGYYLFGYDPNYASSLGQTEYTVTLDAAVNVSLLIVGGGGAGGGGNGGGGGAGELVFVSRVTLPAGTYTVKVGRGGIASGDQDTAPDNGGADHPGVNTEAFEIVATGGGDGGHGYAGYGVGGSGGSSGGGAGDFRENNFAAGTPSKGVNGGVIDSALITRHVNTGGEGKGETSGNRYRAGGGAGGGACAVGGNGVEIATTVTRPNGGDGCLYDITGEPLYWAAGGGSAQHGADYVSMTGGNGGLGGGGGGAQRAASTGVQYQAQPGGRAIMPGTQGLLGDNIDAGGHGGTHTGSGGGGGGWDQDGGNGGSGVLIMRVLRDAAPSASTAPAPAIEVEGLAHKVMARDSFDVPGVSVGMPVELISASPAAESQAQVGEYDVYAFTSAGQTYTLTAEADLEVDVLVVGGGGGGAGRHGGGGGAGGLVFAAGYKLKAGQYTVTVGAGGATGDGPHDGSDYGTNGQNSVFGPLTALGGGFGGGNPHWDGEDGGSGGGAVYTGSIGLAQQQGYNAQQGVHEFGNDGGDQWNNGANEWYNGGGGGAGETGEDAIASTRPGNGGAGLCSAHGYDFAELFGTEYGEPSGTKRCFAGGGAAGCHGTAISTSQFQTGGLGGGGRSGNCGGKNAGFAGMANTGGGGGAASTDNSGGKSGGAGGSGIVLLRVKRVVRPMPTAVEFGRVAYSDDVYMILHDTSFLHTLKFTESYNVDILIVGGGGGGGSGNGGGGGGGGVVAVRNASVAPGDYSVRVGLGGQRGVNGGL